MQAEPVRLAVAAVLAIALLASGGCAGGGSAGHPSTSRFESAALERRERQLRDGLAGRRDPAAEAALRALACRIAPARCDSLRVYVVDAGPPRVHAWANGMLLVHGQLFEFLDEEAELAFALAHELAHLELGHFAAARGIELELAADRWADRRVAALGYRAGAGARLLERLQPDAPSTRTRVAALQAR